MKKLVKKYSTISSRVFKKTPWSLFKVDKFYLPDGSIGTYYYHNSYGGVLVVPVLTDGSIVLTKQFRYLHKRPSYEFPGGGINYRMSAHRTAIKELREETGFCAKRIIEVGSFCPYNGVTNEITRVFLALYPMAGKASPDNTEDITVIKKSFLEVDRMMVNGVCWDGQSIAAWWCARPHIQKFLHI